MKKKHTATFVLSTGRCGTQWLHHIFEKYYADDIHCEHEPIGHDYQARFHLDHPNATAYYQHSSNRVRSHIENIKATLEGGNYLEVGHTCWGALKYFSEIFKGQMKVIWLTRHPLTLAKSWSSHGLYQPIFLPHQREKIFVHPADPGVLFPQFEEQWSSMSQIDKIVYYWLEVNSSIRYLEEEAGIASIHVPFESMFAVEAMRQVISFLELPYTEILEGEFDQRIDQFRYEQPQYNLDSDLTKEKDVRTLCSRLNYTLD